MSDNLNESIKEIRDDIKDLLEIVHFIKDTAASQESVDAVRMDLLEVKADLADRMDSMEAKMVTKDYLDNKLADLRGDMVVLMRKEDEKLKVLAGNLKDKKILTPEDEENLQRLEPFAQAKY